MRRSRIAALIGCEGYYITLCATISRKFSCRLFAAIRASSARPGRNDSAYAGVAKLRAFSQSVLARQYRLNGTTS
jgi:hypothetical protein